MTLPLVWTDYATRDLLAIADDIAPRNFAAAQRLIAAIRHAAKTLPDHSYLYRSTGTIEILAVLRAPQSYPEAPPPRALPHCSAPASPARPCETSPARQDLGAPFLAA